MNAVRLRLRISLAIMMFVLVLGTFVFTILEGRSFFDALYFSVVTMATVGYGDIIPVTKAGKILVLFVIIGGVGTFMSVLANATELFIEKRDEEHRSLKINMISGLFFSEIGDSLLSHFLSLDENREELKNILMISAAWKDDEFKKARIVLKEHKSSIIAQNEDLEPLDRLLDDKKDFLLRLLENPTLLEHGSFTEIIRATFHLREELSSRRKYTSLPAADLKHISGDMERVYRLVLPVWISYMDHLRSHYPYLYSFSVRVNPFKDDHSPVIQA